MPRKLAVILAVLGLFATSWWGARHLLVGSSKLTKEQILKPTNDSSRHTAKVTGPIEVVLSLSGPAPEKAGDQFELVGSVTSSQELNNVEVSWILPRSSKVVRGSLSDRIRLVANQPSEVRILLEANRPGPQRVQLRAAASTTESRYGASAHFDSQPEKRDFLTNDEAIKQGLPVGPDASESKIRQ